MDWLIYIAIAVAAHFLFFRDDGESKTSKKKPSQHKPKASRQTDQISQRLTAPKTAPRPKTRTTVRKQVHRNLSYSLPIIEVDSYDSNEGSSIRRGTSLAMWLEYADANGEISQRHIDAHYILKTKFPNQTYLAATCHLRNDQRTFRIDRIQSLRINNRTYDGRNEVCSFLNL